MPLFCSDPAATETAASRLRSHAADSGGTAPSVRGLFLGADFGAPDWYFVAGVAADASDPAEGTLRRMATADRYAGDYAIATECGFGRRAPDTVAPLLRLHAELADR